MLRTTHSWPLLVRLAVTGAALAATWIIQIPIEREVPGEPFLPFFLVVIASTLAFGANVGFASVALSTVLSLLFFAPAGTLASSTPRTSSRSRFTPYSQLVPLLRSRI